MLRTLVQKSIQFVPWSLRTRIKKIPFLASTQRWVLRNLIEGREFVHEIDAGPATGLVYPVLLPDDKGVWTGTYEVGFFEPLAASVQQGDVCFDIGGWRGYGGGVMAIRGANKVVIFEPLPENALRIQRLLELNRQLPITLVSAAAGAAKGNATFDIMSATSMGKLSNSPFQEHQTSEKSISVSVVSLDAWCLENDCPYPNVVKIDVEGAEMMVLNGAKTIVDKSKPRIFIEAHSRELTCQVTEFLVNRGYEVRSMETGCLPDGKSEPEVCHLMAQPAVCE